MGEVPLKGAKKGILKKTTFIAPSIEPPQQRRIGDRGDRVDRGERSERPERGDRGDRGDRSERPDRGDRVGDKEERRDRNISEIRQSLSKDSFDS